MKYRLIGFGVRRTAVSLEDKVQAIADVYVREKPVKDVLRALYEKADKDLPKNPSLVFCAWKSFIQKRLDAEDAKTIELCKRCGVIEESDGKEKGKGKK